MNKENRKAMKELEEAKKEERLQQEKLDDEAKELEKMSNKQIMLIKKVSVVHNTESPKMSPICLTVTMALVG